MTWEQAAILVVLAGTLAVFVWDRWRYDVVAITSLMACVLLGLIGPDAAFAGFSNPAVITVAAVLVISRALARSGAIDALAGRLIGAGRAQFSHLVSFCLLGALLSGFMNNVGALALLLPIALSTARRHGYSPGLLLMPLSFATLLGGMTTLIGTPPNLLISAFRAEATGERFLLFDFAPTGLALSVAGIAYLLSIGWRLLPGGPGPRRQEDAFEIEDYVTEARIRPSSRVVGLDVAAYEASRNAHVLGVIREGRRLFGRTHAAVLQAEDILLLQADTTTLERTIEEDQLELVERDRQEAQPEGAGPDLIEAVVLPNALVQGSSPSSLDLRRRYGVNLVAAARQGRRFEGRLRNATLSTGDVLLLEGEPTRLRAALADLGCLPLERRKLALEPRRVALPVGLFAAGIAAAASGILPAAAAFTLVVAAMVLLRVIRPAQVYESIDWPVIVLLGAMIPLGDALQDTGAAQLIAGSILMISGEVGPLVVLGAVLLMTMAITPVLNNAATVVIMAPIVISIAARMGVSSDPFLMAVAIGASSDFLTPFGHHNNTIIMGPGGYRFGDFWRVGLGLEAVVIAISLLVIPIVWPF
jgi:di/tricarboxylate transporter